MRDSIARAFAWVLRLCLPARGRHRAPEPPDPVVICAPRTPVPAHVLARTLPSPDPFRIPPYMDPGHVERRREAWKQRERRLAIALALAGVDYPYVAEGVHQVTRGVAA
ncbi:hypothetical protein [Streptomyces tsukubensis]|uniref:hypothetical protein n=1 Tax=Streptomyces tsukubensis TaxID=83656 RepID=UPI0034500FFE